MGEASLAVEAERRNAAAKRRCNGDESEEEDENDDDVVAIETPLDATSSSLDVLMTSLAVQPQKSKINSHKMTTLALYFEDTCHQTP